MARRKEPAISDRLLDELLDGRDAASAFNDPGLFDALKKALAERALKAEMDHHLETEAPEGTSRNGYGRKTVLTDSGSIELSIPRDRLSSFDPQLIAKYQRQGFVSRLPLTKIAAEFGVSDVAVRKKCQKFGTTLPPRSGRRKHA